MFYLIYGGDNFAKGDGGTTLRSGTLPPSIKTQQDPSDITKKPINAGIGSAQNVSLSNLDRINRFLPGYELNNGLCMEVMHFDNIDREFVLSADDTTYHYTRWTIAVSCYVSSERNNFSLNTQPEGVMPSIVESDITIRNFLKANRKRLTILFDSEMSSTGNAASAYQVMLDCPNWGFTIDNEEGPIVHQCNVKSIMGSNGYIVQFVVTCATDDNQCGNLSSAGQANRTVPLLLSNRWNMYHSYQDGYLTRTIQGTAVANVPELKRRNIIIDQLRSMIFPPIYPGFDRSYNVQATSEGSSLLYTITDVQKPMTYIDEILELPQAIKDKVEVVNESNAFSGVYFETNQDVVILRQYMKAKFPDSTQSASPLPFSSPEQTGMDIWFTRRQGLKRDIESLQVVHSMNLLREGSEADLIYIGAEAGTAVASEILGQNRQRAAELENYERRRDDLKRQNKKRKAAGKSPLPNRQRKSMSGRSFRSLRNFSAGSKAASYAVPIAKAIDNLIPKFVEAVNVTAFCKPEGNMKRAFFLALSTAYGLANNQSIGDVDPYSIKVNFDYSAKVIQVQISYSAVDFTQANRRGTGAAKIMIGPQSFLIGGPMDRNVRAQLAMNVGDFTYLNQINSVLGNNIPFILNNTSSGGTSFPASENALSILKELADNDLPDRNCLIMMDQSLFGQSFPTYGPNGDQISRAFVECFVPLFAAPLIDVGNMPVMIGRPTFPQDVPAPENTSSSLSNFYRRTFGFKGDSEATAISRSDQIEQITWTNKPF